MSTPAATATPQRSAWMSRFDGPILTRSTTLGSPLIRHQFKRSFEHVGRNVHMVSVFGRVLLGEEKINEAEVAIYKRIEEITKAIERKAAAIAVVLKDADISEAQMAAYNKPSDITAEIVVPAQSLFLKLLTTADQYAQGFFTLWLAGEIKDTEKSKLEFELKKLLRSIPATTRKMRVFIQTKLDESEHEDAKKEAAAMVADAKDEEIGDDDLVEGSTVAVLAGDAAGKTKGGAKAKAGKKAADAQPVAAEAQAVVAAAA